MTLFMWGPFDKNVYALNASTGRQLWNFTTGGAAFSSPAVADGKVFFGSDDNRIYALNAHSGQLQWSYKTGDRVQSSAAVSDGLVLIGSNDTRVYALNATNGAMVWNYTTGSYVASSPDVAGNTIYVGCFNNNTYALNTTDGALIWNQTTGYDICMQASPAVYEDMVYTGSSGLASFSMPVFKNINQTLIGNNIYALNKTTGATVWSHSTGGGVWSSPAVSDKSVYVGSGDGKLYALNAETGVVQWSYQTNGSVEPSPAIVGGRVYVGSSDGTVYAFGLASQGNFSSITMSLGIVIAVAGIVGFLAVAIILLLRRKRSKTRFAKF